MIPLLGLAALLAQAPEGVTRVSARIAADCSTIDFEVSFSAPGAQGPLLLYLPAERYRHIPEGLRPSDVREAFPGGFDTGGFAQLTVEVDGRPVQGERVQLQGEPFLSLGEAIGHPARIVVRGSLLVPERYGAFGRVGRVLTLGGGWFPRLGAPGVAPEPGPLSFELDVPADLSLVLGPRWSPSQGEEGRRHVSLEVVAADAALILRPASARVLHFAEGRAQFLTGPASALVKPSDAPVLVRELQKAVEDAIRFTPELPGAPAFTSEEPLVLVEAPLRHELAAAVGGVVLVSDRAFRMIEVDRFLRFHRFPVLKEVFAALWARQPGADPVGFRSSFLGSYATDRYVAHVFGVAEDAFDVLSIVSFIPSVDLMLYAPDLPFMSAYFRSTPGADPLAIDLVDAPLGYPSGQRIYAKLIDRFGIARTHAIAEAVAGGASIRSAAQPSFEEEPGGAIASLDAFFETWLGAYPSVAYVLDGYGTGEDGRAFARIKRLGARVAEPITVRLVASDGSERRVVATATSAELRTVTATLSAALDLVEIDPDGRLTESPQPGAVSPKYLHRSSPRWKILLNNFAILFAATEGAIETALDVGLARVHDPHWSFGARAEYASDAVSGTLRGSYSFGELVTPSRLAWSAGLFLDGAYLRPGFAGVKEGGGAISVGASFGYDDRQSSWAPESGTGLRLGVAYQRILGETTDGITSDSVGLSLRFLRQWRLGARHQISVRASIAGYLAGRPQTQLLYSLGGRTGVRGYASTAELGRVRGILSAEWLHPLAPRLDINGFYIAWVTGLDGALYGDVGLVGDDFEEAIRGPIFGDVGYGLRLYIEYFGVRPGVMAIDVAFPLVRARGATELGPPALYIAFSQSFFAF